MNVWSGINILKNKFSSNLWLLTKKQCWCFRVLFSLFWDTSFLLTGVFILIFNHQVFCIVAGSHILKLKVKWLIRTSIFHSWGIIYFYIYNLHPDKILKIIYLLLFRNLKSKVQKQAVTCARSLAIES